MHLAVWLVLFFSALPRGQSGFKRKILEADNEDSDSELHPSSSAPSSGHLAETTQPPRRHRGFRGLIESADDDDQRQRTRMFHNWKVLIMAGEPVNFAADV